MIGEEPGPAVPCVVVERVDGETAGALRQPSDAAAGVGDGAERRLGETGEAALAAGGRAFGDQRLAGRRTVWEPLAEGLTQECGIAGEESGPAVVCFAIERVDGEIASAILELGQAAADVGDETEVLIGETREAVLAAGGRAAGDQCLAESARPSAKRSRKG